VAHVTNAPDHDGPPFDKGTDDTDERMLAAICQAGHSFLAGGTWCFPAAPSSSAAGCDADVMREKL